MVRAFALPSLHSALYLSSQLLSFPCCDLTHANHIWASSLPCSTAVIQGTKDVRLDPQLNKKVWESGIKGVPFRLRVRISRKRNDEEGAKEKLYSFVQAVNVKNPKGLQTSVIEDA